MNSIFNTDKITGRGNIADSLFEKDPLLRTAGGKEYVYELPDSFVNFRSLNLKMNVFSFIEARMEMIFGTSVSGITISKAL